MTLVTSPLAPTDQPYLSPLAGVRLGAIEANLKYRGRRDLLLVALAPGTTVAGVFTKSKTAGAPVVWCRQNLPAGHARGVLVNAGNANVFNGAAGTAAVARAADAAAAVLDCAPEQVFMASTGVIGEPLDAEAIAAAMGNAQQALDSNDWAGAAAAIMTTDTFPKLATQRARIGDVAVTLNGITKGSGMIAPDMATMLGFLFTDAALPAAVLQTLLSRAVAKTYNCITVDSDTSTSDTVLLFATAAGSDHGRIENANDPRLKDFKRALDALCHDLALQVVRDGEGAQKLIEISVAGATSPAAARTIAMSVANSPLVKTAIAGEDANWGRVVMAVGKSGAPADRDRLSIDIGGVTIARDGRRVDGYDEAPVAAHMRGQHINIHIDVGLGRGRATVWSCDLTHAYIDINADYRS
jgi:glutamate N-acetyltransferase/amino-acid N-acetyltransferase